MQKVCHSILKISQRVMEAIAHHKPIVALQSTIISHGMPYPQNKQCALSIQKMVQQQGAVPATVAIFDGKIHVGLQQSLIQRLAQAGTKVKKVSRRDLPFIISNKGMGATTVSATMIAAHSAGIDLFVTGGIGGVHRGFQKTMDVSADLDQLSRTPVTVVSAGIKSILDIPRTLQYLQTKGVPVITYRSKYFPAFFSSSSGLPSPFSVQSQLEAAKIIYSHHQLGFQNGILIGVPNDNPAQGKQIEESINQAIRQSQAQKITGANITPFLLKRVNELTKGRSLKSNVSLIHNNAKVGSRIVVELNNLKRQTRERLSKMTMKKQSKCDQCKGSGCQKCHKNSEYKKQTKQNPQNLKQKQQNPIKIGTNSQSRAKGRLIAIGGAAIDYQIVAKQGKFELHKSCIGKTKKSLGGIARNIVDCSSKLGIKSVLVSAIAKDSESKIISDFCIKNSIDFYPVQAEVDSGYSSCKYYAIMDHQNNQLLGISDMDINQILTFQNIKKTLFNNQKFQTITKDDILVVDSNIPEAQLKHIVKYCAQQFGCFILYEAKGQKSKRIITSGAYPYISLLKMNNLEMLQIQKAVGQLIKTSQKENHHSDRRIQLKKWLSRNLSKKNQNNLLIKSIITNGSQNVQIVEIQNQQQDYKTNYLKVPQSDKILKTTGAGDTFTGTFCSMILLGKTKQQALKYALAASKINVQSPVRESVISDKINIENLSKTLKELLI